MPAEPEEARASTSRRCAGWRERTLPRPIFDFADGGAEDEWTLRRNETAFDEIQLLPQPLRGSPTRDLSIELFGKTLSMPVMVGPTGLSGTALAGRRALQCARRDRRRHGVLPQPWLGLHDRGAGRDRRRAALDAGFRLPRPRADARIHRAGDRQPATTRWCSPPTTSSPATASATSATASPSRPRSGRPNTRRWR